MRWGRSHREPRQAAPEADDQADDATPSVAPLVWEGRLPTVSSPPVRIAARRAADLAAEPPTSATPDAA